MQSTETASTPLGFPSKYGLYTFSDTNIISPLFSPLNRGKSYDFKLTTTAFDNIYLYMENGSQIKLDKDGNVFSKSNVAIQGTTVIVCTLQNNTFNLYPNI